MLLLAAGRGERLGGGPKAYAILDGTPLLRRSADAAAAARLVEGLVVAVPPGTEEQAGGVLAGLARPFVVVRGGPTRQDSAALALVAAGGAEAIVVHDAARPLCPPWLFDACLQALDEAEAVVAAVPVAETVKVVEGGLVRETLDRASLVAAQTPQAFRAEVYRQAHQAAARDGVVATDDAALVERLGVPVRVVPGAATNLKVTTAFDLAVAEAILRGGR